MDKDIFCHITKNGFRKLAEEVECIIETGEIDTTIHEVAEAYIYTEGKLQGQLTGYSRVIYYNVPEFGDKTVPLDSIDIIY